MPNELAKFSGNGTVFRSDIVGMLSLVNEVDVRDTMKMIQGYLDVVLKTIEGQSGTVVRYAGDAVEAFWGPVHSNHAQRAFDTSLAILGALPKGTNVSIVLGTGEVGAGYVGITKQAQIVGKAVAIVDRLSKLPREKCPSIRMSQFTLEAIQTSLRLEESGSIEREGLEPLKVYVYRPAN